MIFDPVAAQKQLSVHFEKTALLQQALSHRSVGDENNERLEFLGDAVLGFVIADVLFEKFPDVDEGRLSRLRSSLVNQKSLAKLATKLKIGELLLLGPGELKSGGFRRPSILSDALEAIIGALLKDQGYPVAAAWVRQLFQDKIDALHAGQVLKDPKTRLQELMQSRGQPLPDYSLLKTTGLDHDQTFYVQCKIENLRTPVEAHGASRREAEQIAAEKVLAELDRVKSAV